MRRPITFKSAYFQFIQPTPEKKQNAENEIKMRMQVFSFETLHLVSQFGRRFCFSFAFVVSRQINREDANKRTKLLNLNKRLSM